MTGPDTTENRMKNRLEALSCATRVRLTPETMAAVRDGNEVGLIMAEGEQEQREARGIEMLLEMYDRIVALDP